MTYDFKALFEKPIEAKGALTFENAAKRLNQMLGIFIVVDHGSEPIHGQLVLVKCEIVGKIMVPKLGTGATGLEDVLFTCVSATQRGNFTIKLSEFNGESAVFGGEARPNFYSRIFTNLLDAAEYMENVKLIRYLHFHESRRPGELKN
jgi:hypothetical protein